MKKIQKSNPLPLLLTIISVLAIFGYFLDIIIVYSAFLDNSSLIIFFLALAVSEVVINYFLKKFIKKGLKLSKFAVPPWVLYAVTSGLYAPLIAFSFAISGLPVFVSPPTLLMFLIAFLTIRLQKENSKLYNAVNQKLKYFAVIMTAGVLLLPLSISYGFYDRFYEVQEQYEYSSSEELVMIRQVENLDLNGTFGIQHLSDFTTRTDHMVKFEGALRLLPLPTRNFRLDGEVTLNNEGNLTINYITYNPDYSVWELTLYEGSEYVLGINFLDNENSSSQLVYLNTSGGIDLFQNQSTILNNYYYCEISYDMHYKNRGIFNGGAVVLKAYSVFDGLGNLMFAFVQNESWMYI